MRSWTPFGEGNSTHVQGKISGIKRASARAAGESVSTAGGSRSHNQGRAFLLASISWKLSGLSSILPDWASCLGWAYSAFLSWAFSTLFLDRTFLELGVFDSLTWLGVLGLFKLGVLDFLSRLGVLGLLKLGVLGFLSRTRPSYLSGIVYKLAYKLVVSIRVYSDVIEGHEAPVVLNRRRRAMSGLSTQLCTTWRKYISFFSFSV